MQKRRRDYISLVKQMQCHDDGSLVHIWIVFDGYQWTSTGSTTYTLKIHKNFRDIFNLSLTWGAAHWAETDYDLSNERYAVLPEGKGKSKDICNKKHTYTTRYWNTTGDTSLNRSSPSYMEHSTSRSSYQHKSRIQTLYS